LASVEPRVLAALKPETAALAGARRSMIGPKTLLAAMTQSMVFPEQVFLMMMLPMLSMSMPRSAPVQLLPSMRLSPEKRDAAGGDLDAVLASDAGDVARKIVRAGLGDFEEAVRIAGRVRCIDRCARLDLIECLHRGRRRAWRGERALGKDDGRRVGRCAGSS
jgi:hypothetical protein